MRFSRLRRSAAAVLGLTTVLAGLAAAPSPAAAATYTKWYGTVTKVADGDTLWVDINGDGNGPVKIRNAGIQALEIGQCGAAAATRRLSQLVLGKPVRLTARYPSSSSAGRPLRFVDLVNGTSVFDVQHALLQEGLVLWENIKEEPARSPLYQRAMEDAAAAERGLWRGTDCGAGPSATAGFRMWIHYDGEGDEGRNPNAEWVRIQSTSSTDVDLGGWWLRDATQRPVVRFPAGTVLRAGGHVTVRGGTGTPTSSTFFFGSPSAMFSNISSPAVAGDLGDGVYLFDPQGDIRSHVTYPCMRECADPAAGALTFGSVVHDAEGSDAENPGGEYVTITAQGRPVDLTRKVLVLGGHVMELPIGTVLQPGERFRVHSGRGTPGPLVRYWQSDGALMSNAGGEVLLRNSEGTPLACRDWGTGAC